jgi:hypothetical protein
LASKLAKRPNTVVYNLKNIVKKCKMSELDADLESVEKVRKKERKFICLLLASNIVIEITTGTYLCSLSRAI